MLLTALELWVAADKAAIHAVPMLRNYDPEVPAQVFQALLLGLRRDMDRLHRAETYLVERQTFANRLQRPSVFRSYGSEKSFPVQYYSQSLIHKELMRKIVQNATAEKHEKGVEFRKLKELHAQLKRDYNRNSCEYVEVQNGGLRYSKHSTSCNRCSLLSQANNLKIDVHEWPLCEDVRKAQAAVFELDVPPVFGEWRHLTLYLIDNVLQCGDPSSDPLEWMLDLQTYHALAEYAESSNPWRVRLMSATKSHMNTHRRSIKVDIHNEADVYVNNGLRFTYFDSIKGRYLTKVTRQWLCHNSAPSAYLNARRS